jgi:hypothetical protein
MREAWLAPFSLREKVPVEPAPYLIRGRMRVRRSSDAGECFKVQQPAVAMALRRTLTPTPLSPALPFGAPMGEGL